MTTTPTRKICAYVTLIAVLIGLLAVVELGQRAVNTQPRDSMHELTSATASTADSGVAAEKLVVVVEDGVVPVVNPVAVLLEDDPASVANPTVKMSADLVAAIGTDPDVRHRVIVQITDRDAPESASVRGLIREFAVERGAVAARDISIIGGVLLDLDRDGLVALAGKSSVARMSLDAPVQGCANVSASTVGADLMGNALDGSDLDGRGVVVAVIDSGVAYRHADFGCTMGMPRGERRPIRSAIGDLADALEARFDGDVRRNSRVISLDFLNPTDNGKDDYGHGTHIAGIVGGCSKATARETGVATFAGMAPSATILNLRVLDDTGAGTTAGVMEAIGFIVANQDLLNVRAVNLSLGHPVFESFETDPLALACAAASEAGIAVVCSAGNNGHGVDGTGHGTINSPANAPWVITVGATDTKGTAARSDDTVAAFSSRGPTAVDGHVKPDIVAPGTGIVSCGAKNGYLDDNFDLMVDLGNEDLEEKYMRLSGTSMSAGFVTGTLACMFQANPSLTPNSAKAILMYTAQKMVDPDIYAQGSGYLNAEGAVRLALAVRQDSNTLEDGEFWLAAESPEAAEGMVDPFTDIAGERVYWGSAFVYGDSHIWYGGPGGGAGTNGFTWGGGFNWDQELNWANGDPWYDTMMAEQQEVFGNCFLWYFGCGGGGRGGGGTNGAFGWSSIVVTGMSLVWDDPGLFNTWSATFVDPASIEPELPENSVLTHGAGAPAKVYTFGQAGGWFWPQQTNN